jgi:hypothetical protein
MPPLTFAPSPERFAKAWSKRFDGGVRQRATDDTGPSVEQIKTAARSPLEDALDHLEQSRARLTRSRDE